jgi:hypothetical protein
VPTSRKIAFALVTVVGLVVLVEGGARLAMILLGPGEAPLGAGWETRAVTDLLASRPPFARQRLWRARTSGNDS